MNDYCPEFLPPAVREDLETSKSSARVMPICSAISLNVSGKAPSNGKCVVSKPRLIRMTPHTRNCLSHESAMEAAVLRCIDGAMRQDARVGDVEFEEIHGQGCVGYTENRNVIM
jgi:hypothetical protein